MKRRNTNKIVNRHAIIKVWMNAYKQVYNTQNINALFIEKNTDILLNWIEDYDLEHIKYQFSKLGYTISKEKIDWFINKKHIIWNRI